jgi:hypothetical protein
MKTEDLSFEEAVRALVDKRCDAIETDKPYSIGKTCFIWRGGHLQWENGNDANITPHDVLTKRFRLINPKVPTTKTPVKRWAKIGANGHWLGSTGDKEQAERWLARNPDCQIVEGVFNIELPAPEEVTEWEGILVQSGDNCCSVSRFSVSPPAEFKGRRVRVALK